MKVSEVLYGAADLVECDGWSGIGRGPGFCASNAIRKIALRAWPDEEQFTERHAGQMALATHLGGSSVGHIFDWNDTPGRTAEEVIEALRACAVIEAAKEDEAADQSPAATRDLEPAL